MKHPVLLVCLFVVGRVSSRASIPIEEPTVFGKDESPYEIEDIIVEETDPVVKTLDVQEQNNEDVEEAIPQARVLYTGSQLWKTIVDTNNKVRVLVELKDENDISMWGGNSTSVDILVKPGSVPKVAAVLRKENIAFELLIEDLQTAIDTENPPINETYREGHGLTWQSYHRLKDINHFIDYHGTSYPNFCTVKTIGRSVQGKDIKLLKLSNGNPGNKAIWIDGGIHAREWITPATVTYIINYLVKNFETEPDYMQNIDWYILPVANPDGYEYSHMVDRLWRKNRARSGQCAGTDLNRNFGYRWGGSGASKNPCAETYAGTSAFSEPETAAIQRFIKGTPALWRAYISFHSYGQYILYPWGYARVVPPDYKDLDEVGKNAAAAIRTAGGPSYTVGPAANTLYPASGGSDDWAKGSMRIKYAYTIELRDNGRYGFVLPASYINPTAKEALSALRVIAQAAAKA